MQVSTAVGFLDEVSVRALRGWAHKNGEPTDLVARVNGQEVASFWTGLPRPDLAALRMAATRVAVSMTNLICRRTDIASDRSAIIVNRRSRPAASK
jgi:hypothetical protein